MFHAFVSPSPSHHVVVVIPGIVYVYVVVGGVIAEADHSVALEMNKNRPSGIYLGFILSIGEPINRAIHFW